MLDISAWIILLWILWLYLHGWHIDLIQLTPPEQIGQEVIYDGSGASQTHQDLVSLINEVETNVSQ